MFLNCNSKTKIIYNFKNKTFPEHKYAFVLHFHRRASIVLLCVAALTSLFIVAEAFGGYLAHSLAIMSDSCHMVSDLSSLLVSILAIHLARRKPTTAFPFGFHRAEVLGALSRFVHCYTLFFAILKCVKGVRINGLQVLFNENRRGAA